MREILFRGKTAKGKWVYGAYYKQTHYYGDEKNIDCIITSTDVLSNDLWLDYEEVINETVGQFTGLTDKNGKKIFEGDILAVEDDEGDRQLDGVVKYGKFNCSCCDGVYGWYIDGGDIRRLDSPSDDDLMIVVIGNIHDNPELLEGVCDGD